MAYEIDQRKIRGVVHEVNRIFEGQHDFNHGEAIVGLAEYIGRLIVDAARTSIQANEMKQVVFAHIERTITVGAEAQEKRIITGV